eukprot:GHUV01035004.1.p1 GENE.GHUV01035004.1~~GHUV01035004.1.p1  ORF type:complete len:694 (+),score=284.91 GHUV01035004.1:467-2548(+)
MMQAGNRGFSLIQDSGTYHSSCGYCNDEGGLSSQAHGKCSHGMHAYRMSVYDYQELLDQGWRRSGKYLYKPDNKVTCCRQYTIRLKVDDFKPSKSHKKLLRKWEQFLAGHIQHDRQGADHDMGADELQQQHRGAKRSRNSRSSTGDQQGPRSEHSSNTTKHSGQQQGPGQHQLPSSGRSSLEQLSQVELLLQRAVQALQESGQLPQQGLPDVSVVVPPPQKLSKLPAGTVFTSASGHALAAAVRKAQQQQQQPQANGQQQQRQLSGNDLADALVNRFNEVAAAQPDVAVVASAVKGHINFLAVPNHQQHHQQDASAGAQHTAGQQQVPKQQPQQPGQEQVQQQQHQHSPGQQQHQKHPGHHGQQDSEQASQQQQQNQRPEQQDHQHTQQQHPVVQQHQLEMRMVPNQFIQEEYELYCRYQLLQHHDDPEDLTPSRYRHFLVDTPLIPVTPPPQHQHQQQAQSQPPAVAAAAGVAGSVPSCGYGSFHQQYWLDGKLVAVAVVDILPRYGALQEIHWVAAAHAAGAEQLEYYYLGYYIHNCPKMAYKAEYSPSELLCPEKQVWVKVDRTVLQALDRSPYVVLSCLPGVEMKPNLSVPRPVPATASAAAAASSAGPEHLSLQQQIRTRLQQRQQLDSQLLFLLKQPVRWGALRESGLLDEAQIGELEERLAAWRAVAGETAAYLLYATPSELLPVG